MKINLNVSEGLKHIHKLSLFLHSKNQYFEKSIENEEKAIMNLCSRKQKFIDKKENGSYFSLRISNMYILECRLVLLLKRKK